MLKQLRNKKTAKKIWIALTILILPAFVFWGFGSFLRSRQESSYVGKISGKNVPLLEYKEALEAVRNQALIQFGDNLSEIEKKLNLETLAWDRLILLAQAKRLKLSATDKEVVQLIESYPFFQRKGVFDNQIYSQMLEYVFHTQARIFEEQARQSIILSKLYKAATGNINLTDYEVRKEYRKMNEQISLYYIAGLTNDFLKEVTASGDEIKDYFTKNPFLFKEPLSFNVEYISIPSEGKSEIEMKEVIRNLASLLNKKGDFAKAAAELNLRVKETGLFSETDPIPGIGWSPQIISLISKLKTGEFSAPIYLDKYYYVLRLKERKEPYIPDFQAIKNGVKEAFIKEKAKKIARQKIEECLKELEAAYKVNPKSISFDRPAKTYGLKSASTDLFKYGSYIEGVGSSDDFFTAAQTLKEDAFSAIIEMPSGFYIIKTKSHVPIDEKKFLEEKADFTRKLLQQKREDYFNTYLGNLKAKSQFFKAILF